MMDIVGIGESDIDIYLDVDHVPGKGSKARAQEIGKFPGGMIGNFCSGAVKHGMKCGIVSVLGDDANGKIALEDYKHRGIDLSGIKIVKGGQTFYCVVFIDSSGEKTLTAVVTDLISPALEDIDFDYVRQAKYAHMNSMDYELVKYVAMNLEGSDTKLSLDYETHADNPGFRSWKGILEQVEVFFINEDGLQSMFPDKTMQESAKIALDLGIAYFVVTCAEKGGCIFTREGAHSYEAFAVDKIVDTTGAGDCFNAAFLSAVIGGMSVAESARYAAAAATLSIRHMGSRTGLPSKTEVLSFLASN